jgi:hypothetical protein
MSENTRTGLDLSVNPLTVIAVFIGAVIAYYLYQFVNAGKQGLAKISKAADKAAETAGYVTSEGQNDPLVKYNEARIAFARAQGYAEGTDNFRNPPGFPTYDTWISTNSQDQPGWLSSFNTSFWSDL